MMERKLWIESPDLKVGIDNQTASLPLYEASRRLSQKHSSIQEHNGPGLSNLIHTLRSCILMPSDAIPHLFYYSPHDAGRREEGDRSQGRPL